MIKCPNCGASVDVKNGYCEYCNSKIGYLQEWIIEDQKYKKWFRPQIKACN